MGILIYWPSCVQKIFIFVNLEESSTREGKKGDRAGGENVYKHRIPLRDPSARHATSVCLGVLESATDDGTCLHGTVRARAVRRGIRRPRAWPRASAFSRGIPTVALEGECDCQDLVTC